MAASPDDWVYDPTEDSPFGLAEYKNPNSARNMTITEACNCSKAFCLQKNGHRWEAARLLLPNSEPALLCE